MDNTQIEGSDKINKFGILESIGLIGAISTIIIFLSSIAAWSFARGFTFSLNLNSSIFSFSNSIEKFGGIAFQYVGAFILAFVFGVIFCLLKNHKDDKLTKRRSIQYISLLIFFGIINFFASINIVMDSEYELNTYYDIALTIVSMVSPFFLGYLSMRNYEKKVRFIFVIILSYLSVDTLSSNLYFYGIKQGHELFYTKFDSGVDFGMAAIKMSEYPIVTLITSDSLLLKSTPIRSGNDYIYIMTDTCFLRLLNENEQSKYFLENYNYHITTIEIPNKNIEQIVYK